MTNNTDKIIVLKNIIKYETYIYNDMINNLNLIDDELFSRLIKQRDQDLSLYNLLKQTNKSN